jgi:alpha-N-acetylglucosaminidase
MIQKRTFFILLFTISFECWVVGSPKLFTSVQTQKVRTKSVCSEIDATRAVLKRVLGKKANTIHLEISNSPDTNDSYQYVSQNGKLMVKGSSCVALTRGVYDYLRNQNLGMLGWAGSQFHLPSRWPSAPQTTVTSPFRIRQAYNVVTAGYTTPYWTWKRWEQELDWQAIHGFNMLLAPIATEAIAIRVWKRLGLNQREIDEFYVGPAHLPWQRMGNICKVGGTLPSEWHVDQIALQHKVLKRMRELGMQPVVQSFAGFVPKGIKRLYPDIVLHNTLWNSGFDEPQRPVMLMPGDSLFAKITKMYMEEWQKEFGQSIYYLVDSFNEMELPETNKPVTDLLAEYGEKTFQSIMAGNPDAVWVIQGWMFGYQRDIWTPDRIKALFSKVPDHKVLILDYANDYGNNWEPVNGFNGKQWAYGFVPNMGGKTAYTGDMSLYATGAATTLASPKKNNLVGFSISGEGLENNEVLYELMTDAAWSLEPIKLDSWLTQYSVNRYGACPAAMTESWNLLRKTCYSKLMDHPQFGWQVGRCGFGSVNRDPEFHKATGLFLSCADKLGQSANYRADALERTAISLGLKADEWFKVASDAYSLNDIKTGDLAGKRGLELLMELDRLLQSHPLNRLDRWLATARQHSTNSKLQQFYESNARQIVTIWGPPVNDYSCRMWSGLVRDFYHCRMAKILESLKTGNPFDKNKWEFQWVEGTGVSPQNPYANPISEAKKLLDRALNEKLPSVLMPKGESIGNWSSANVGEEWKTVEWPISSSQLKSIEAVVFIYTDGKHRLDIQEVSLVADGKVLAVDKHVGFAGIPSSQNRYVFKLPATVQANNGCVVRAIVRADGGSDSKGRIEVLTQ